MLDFVGRTFLFFFFLFFFCHYCVRDAITILFFFFSLFLALFLDGLPKVLLVSVLRLVSLEACDPDLTHSLDMTRLIHGNQHSQRPKKPKKQPEIRKQVSLLASR